MEDELENVIATAKNDIIEETGTIKEDETVNEISENSTKLFKSAKDVLIIVGLSLIIFSATCCESVLGPFFTPEAARKGASQTLVGGMFSVYPFVMFLLSPIVGKYMPRIGVKFCLIAGSFLVGGTEIIFAFVDQLPSGSVYITFCFLIRIVTAVGSAMSTTASLSILTVTFREHLAMVIGITEVFTGLGFMTGPALGGILYKYGGFKLPFLFCGGILFVVLLGVFWLLPQEEAYHTDIDGNINKEEEKLTPINEALRIPGIAVIGLCAVTAGIVPSFFDPTLTPYLLKIDPQITSEQVGLVFLIPPTFYMISTPLMGSIVDKKINGRLVIVIGHIGNVIGYFLLGPSPIIQTFIGRSILLVCISFGIMGFFTGCLMVPLMSDMQRSAKKGGLPQNLGTDSLISGIFNGAFSIGCSIGPLLGSILAEYIDFQWALTTLSFFVLAELLVLIVFILWERKSSRAQGYSPVVVV